MEGNPQWMGSFNSQLLQKAEVEKVEVEMEEDEEEEEFANTILQVSLRPAPFASVQKMNFPELCRKFRCFSLDFFVIFSLFAVLSRLHCFPGWEWFWS